TAPLWAGQPKADPADEKALRELHQAFLAAFNKGDAETVAAMYAPDANLLRLDGQMVNGLAELKKGLADIFAHPNRPKLESPFGSVRFITPDVAIADRPSGLMPAPKGGPSKVHATVVYVKQDGKWLMSSVRLAAPFQPSKQ